MTNSCLGLYRSGQCETWCFTNIFAFSRGPEFSAVMPYTCEFKILGDSDGKVLLIFLPSNIVSALFNAGDMSTENFVQALMDSYHLPPFQSDVLPNSDKPCYFVTSPEGFEIAVAANKELLISRIPTAGERKFG